MHILFNARIHTLDIERPVATAIAIDRGQILALGDVDLIRDLGGGAQLQDAGGLTIIPGLTDAHIHLQYYALGLQKVDCETAAKAECLNRIAQRAAVTSPGAWIQGHGWNQNLWPEGFGRAADLDLAAPNNPTYLTAKSLHAGWANHAALQAAGIDRNTPDPADGKIEHNEHGAPTGILLEGAMRLLAEAIPEPSLAELAASIEKAQAELWKLGITGVHDFDRQACFGALQVLHAEEQLKLRVVKSIPLEALPHAVEVGLRSGFGDDMLRIGGIKAFMDGALGPHTAAMLEPYENDPQNRGMLLIDAEELYEAGHSAAAGGLSMAVHAIGDRANHEALNAFEQLRKFEIERGIRGLRHRIEHVQILHPQDQHRLAQLGIIASMQPIHATSDMLMADEYWGTRAAHSYGWRTQLEQGAVLVFGSDAPVESPNPFWGLHAAVTRRRADGSPGPSGWHPQQRLNLFEALHGFTLGPAYAAGRENQLGKLTPGYLADLLVLDTDPFTCDPQAIQDIRPVATMVGGEWVFSEL